MTRILLFLVLLAGATTASAQHNLDALAHRIIHTTAGIEAGEVVVIEGGQHTVPLMEALAVEVTKAGAFPRLLLSTDRANEAFWAQPDAYLQQQDPSAKAIREMADVYIDLPSQEDETFWKDVAPERRALVSEAYADFVEVMQATRNRNISVRYPSASDARESRLDLAQYERLHWAALGADYDRIAAQASSLSDKLRGAREVRVTTPAGTDFTFAVGDRRVYAADGVISDAERASGTLTDLDEVLPGGAVDVAPLETSANGRVVVPRAMCNDEPLRDASFTFEQGVMKNLRASQGQACVEDMMRPYSGPKDRLGYFAIGLNPALQPMEEGGAEFRPWAGAGVVTVEIGRNTYLGGANDTQSEFGFQLTNATVTIDGEVVVRDGQLVGDLASR